MSALEFPDFQGSSSGLLGSQNDRPTRQSVLRPFCGKLNVDEKLELSNENFNHFIENSFNTNKTPLSHLTTRPLFHTPCADPVCIQDIHRLQNWRDWRSVWDTIIYTWRLEDTDESVEKYKVKRLFLGSLLAHWASAGCDCSLRN